jgi:hypothetical protein
LSEYQSLLRSPGWERLVDLATEQVELRQSIIMTREERELGDFIEVLRLKAEARAIKLFITLPETVVEQLKEELGYVEPEVALDASD